MPESDVARLPNCLEDWLVYIEKQHPVEIDLGLDRIKTVADRLRLPGIASKIVVVAGTNGKGSCVKTLESLALAAGLRVASYTSPHLLRYNERVRLHGQPVDDQRLCQAFETVEQARGATSLTYFEVGTLAALLLMAAEDLDLALLEIGLGGRFDAVNIIDSDVAVITPIDIDHASWLGNDRETIALEKAGIARAGKPVVCADPEPPATLVAHLESLACHSYFLGEAFAGEINDNTLAARCTRLNGDVVRMQNLPVPVLPLASVMAALQSWCLLGFELDQPMVHRVLSNLELAGRYQVVKVDGCRVILDVAHNPAASHYLAERLQKEAHPLVCVMAIMADKDVEGVLDYLVPVVDQWCVGNLSGNSRALPAEALEKLLYTRHSQVHRSQTLMEAFDSALNLIDQGGTVIVCGSFITVAQILQREGVTHGH
jgi:dihydrofolate synthase / folylpolyglutamate synthase